MMLVAEPFQRRGCVAAAAVMLLAFATPASAQVTVCRKDISAPVTTFATLVIPKSERLPTDWRGGCPGMCRNNPGFYCSDGNACTADLCNNFKTGCAIPPTAINPCGPGGSCVDQGSSYDCDCGPGYQLSANELLPPTCVAADECKAPDTPYPCTEPNSYCKLTCECLEGYGRIGNQCVANPCAAEAASTLCTEPNTECRQTGAGTYDCPCVSGTYFFDELGRCDAPGDYPYTRTVPGSSGCYAPFPTTKVVNGTTYTWDSSNCCSKYEIRSRRCSSDGTCSDINRCSTYSDCVNLGTRASNVDLEDMVPPVSQTCYDGLKLWDFPQSVCNNGVCLSGICFPGDATVRAEGGGLVEVRDVRIGDRVGCFRAHDGSFGLCEVLSFTTADPDDGAALLRLRFSSSPHDGADGGERGFLDVTGEHFVWVLQSSPASSGAQDSEGLPFGTYVMAKDVRVGDYLVSPASDAESAGLLVLRRVEDVSARPDANDGTGRYGILVTHGALPIVNGVVASTFAHESPVLSWHLWYHLWGGADSTQAVGGGGGDGGDGSGLPTVVDRLEARGVRAADLKASSAVFSSGHDAFNDAVIKLPRLLADRDGLFVDETGVIKRIKELAAAGVSVSAEEIRDIVLVHAFPAGATAAAV